MTHDPVPQRISDADRDAAASMLREHFEAGRLDAGEFDERLSAALSARIAADLTPLFVDLPHPHPQPTPGSTAMAPRPYSPAPAPSPYSATPAPQAGSTDWINVAHGVIWPIAIVAAVLTGNWLMWIVLAIVGNIVLGQIKGNQRKPPPYLEK